MIDWPHNRELLLAESERLVQALFAENRERGDCLVAIGYVFEFGRGQLEFDMCANTAQSAEEALAELLAEDPDESPDEVRWNSGDFDYPGGVSDHYGGFSAEWRTELKRLDQLAEDDEEQSAAVHEGIANICCEVLAELATRGVIAEWSSIDFNVAALLDEIDQVKARDQQIRRLIAAAG